MGKAKPIKAIKKFAAGKTGKSLGKIAGLAAEGDIHALEMKGINRLGKAIGEKNLDKAQRFGEKTLGKKNYQTTAKVVKRGNNIAGNVASMYAAGMMGNDLGVAKYGGKTIQAAAGEKAIDKARQGIKNKVGAENFHKGMDVYKGVRKGVALGYSLHHLSSAHSDFADTKNALNAAKLGLAGYHAAHATHDMAMYTGKMTQKYGPPGQTQKQSAVPGSSLNVIKPKPLVGGGGGKKPKISTV